MGWEWVLTHSGNRLSTALNAVERGLVLGMRAPRQYQGQTGLLKGI